MGANMCKPDDTTHERIADCQKKINLILHKTPIPFHFNAAHINTGGDGILQQVSLILKEFPGLGVHASGLGTLHTPLTVTHDRCKTVRAALMRFGCSNPISVKGMGHVDGKGDRVELTVARADEVASEMNDEDNPLKLLNRRLEHVLSAKMVAVSVVSASNVRDADLLGKSDCYCIVETENKVVAKTKVVNESLNPIWNLTEEVPNYHLGEPIHFTVFDQDFLRPDDMLGKASLPYDKFSDRMFDGDLPLLENFEVEKAAPVLVPDGRILQVNLQDARGLRDTDWLGKSDCYCVVGIQSQHVFKSKVVNNCTEPVWEQTKDIHGYQPHHVLTFFIFDQDHCRPDELLGQVSLGYEKFQGSAGFSGELELLETKKAKVPDGKILLVTIISAKDLRNADWVGKSDPYCVCEMGGHQILRTKVIEDSTTPVWNESKETVHTTLEDIKFTIWDRDRLRPDNSLGHCTLSARQFDSGYGFSGDLEVLEAGKGIKATLKVTVKVVRREDSMLVKNSKAFLRVKVKLLEGKPVIPPAPPVPPPKKTQGSIRVKARLVDGKGITFTPGIADLDKQGPNGDTSARVPKLLEQIAHELKLFPNVGLRILGFTGKESTTWPAAKLNELAMLRCEEVHKRLRHLGVSQTMVVKAVGRDDYKGPCVVVQAASVDEVRKEGGKP